MEVDLEYIIKEVRKIQAIADLLSAHSDKEYGNVGVLIGDISYPLLEKLKSYEST